MNFTLPEIISPDGHRSAGQKLELVITAPMELMDPLQTRRSSSSMEVIDVSSSQWECQPLDVTASLSVEGASLSMTVVLEPSRSQKSFRLSFPGSFPVESPTTHRRLQTDETADSRSRYSYCSDESHGDSSDLHASWPDIDNVNGLSTSSDHQTNSTCNVSGNRVLYQQSGISTWSLNFDDSGPDFMAPRSSVDSEIDPYLVFTKAEDAVCHPGGRQRAISAKSSRPKLIQSSDRIVANNSCPIRPILPAGESKCLNRVSLSPQPFVTNVIPGWTTSHLLNLFPSPPSTRALVPKHHPNIESVGTEDFVTWLQQIQARFDSRQSMIKKKGVIMESGKLTSLSHNSAMASRKNSSGSEVHSLPFRIPSLDLDTHDGVLNDLRFIDLVADPQIDIPGYRPLSLCHVSVRETLIDVCEEPEFTEAEELEERGNLIERTDLDEAQRCVIKDEQGRKRLFRDVIRSPRTIVIFLRFFWCAKCQDYVRSISKIFAPGTEERRKLDETKTTVIFIGSGSWKMIASYRAFLGCSFDFFTDMTTTSRLFRKMGMNRILLGGTSDRSVLNPTLTIWQTMIASAKSIPKFPLHRPGSFTQLGGEFCLQNLSAEVEGELTPSFESPHSRKADTAKFSLKFSSFSRKSIRQYLVPEELPDPFRRSYHGQQTLSMEISNSFPIIQCLYANRMKSSRSHGNYHLLFKSIGLNVEV